MPPGGSNYNGDSEHRHRRPALGVTEPTWSEIGYRPLDRHSLYSGEGHQSELQEVGAGRDVPQISFQRGCRYGALLSGALSQ